MSETADKYRRRGYWLKYLALRHIELLYYKPPFLSTTFSPYFHLFFKKFSTFLLDCRSIFPQSLLAVSTLYTPIHNRCLLEQQFIHTLIRHFINFLLSSVFYKFSLVFFSAMCYIKKNVFTGYTVTILFFQITIQQILFREAFSL